MRTEWNKPGTSRKLHDKLIRCSSIACGLLVVLGSATQAVAQTPPYPFNAVYTFVSSSDGWQLNNLVEDPKTTGLFYGTASYGGKYGMGTLFSTTFNGSPPTILHAFNYTNDAENPYGNLVLDSSRNQLVGTCWSTYFSTQNNQRNGGSVYTYSLNGAYNPKLYWFDDITKGIQPESGISIGSDGNYYGVTHTGGLMPDGKTFARGVIYQLNPSNGVYTVLHTFGYAPVWNAVPNGLLLLNDEDRAKNSIVQGWNGRFYGVSSYGGRSELGTTNAGKGTIFEFSQQNGTYYAAIDHSFQDGTVPNDGAYPGGTSDLEYNDSGFTVGPDGLFYGTTEFGGTSGGGVIFRYDPVHFNMQILHSFADGSVLNDGFLPVSALVQGSDGAFYGTTQYGGKYDRGTIYRIVPPRLNSLLGSNSSRPSSYSIIRSFNGTDGQYPGLPPVLSRNGNLYGLCPYTSTNNGGGTEYIVGMPPLPNLSIRGAAASAVVVQGRTISMNFQCANNGVYPVYNAVVSNPIPSTCQQLDLGRTQAAQSMFRSMPSLNSSGTSPAFPALNWSTMRIMRQSDGSNITFNSAITEPLILIRLM